MDTKKYNTLSFLKKRKLRVDVLFLFVSLFIIAVVAIIYYTYFRQTETLLKLSDSLINRTEQIIVERIHNYLKPSTVAELTSHMLQDDTLNLTDQKQLISFMQGALKSHPQIFSFYLADINGSFIEEQRYLKEATSHDLALRYAPANTATVTRIVNKAIFPPIEMVIFHNQIGHVLKTKKVKYTFYNLLKQPWFVGAKKQKGSYWIGVYRFFDVGRAGITVSYPMRNDQGKFLGVVGTDFKLNALNRFLEKLDISKNALVIILNKQDELMASSDRELNTMILQSAKTSLIHINALKNKRISDAFMQYKKTRKSSFTFSIGGKEYIASFTEPFTQGIKAWTVGVIVPVSDFVGPVELTRQVTLFFALAVLLVGVGLIVVVSQNISGPIVSLAEEVEKMKVLNLDDKIVLKTHILEVQVMADSLVSMQRGLRSFSKYVPKELVQQLIQTGEVAKLSSQKKEMTIMFTDIADFSAIAENLPGENLAKSLSEYLGVMSDIIRVERGVVDKFIGDAVMAFWGAPLADPTHVLDACKAALKCCRKIAELNLDWSKQGRPTFFTRFGLHTGDIIVGNMGSPDRMSYTVIGDNVNLAARLESINKIYGTQIIASHDIYQVAAEYFLFRPLDIVTVKGRKQPTLIYEMLAAKSHEDENLRATEDQLILSRMTEKAFFAYTNKQWQLALELYQVLLSKFPDDKLAVLYTTRCKNELA